MTTAEPFVLSREEHEGLVAAERAARLARLQADDGWLTVVGKTWLQPGTHLVGSAPEAAVVLPEGRAPAVLGSLTYDGVSVRFAGATGVEVTSGAAVTSAVEMGSEGVRWGAFTFQLVRRGGDVAVRVRDAESQARRSFGGIRAYPVNPAWRVVATLRPHTQEQRVVLEDGDGRPQEYVSPGTALFEYAGARLELEPVYESDRRRLFLLFADPTNRDETYGAGRFLYAPLPVSGRVLLDFNLAFNPPCAFTPYATCPLPPANNRLALRVEAGEKKPANA